MVAWKAAAATVVDWISWAKQLTAYKYSVDKNIDAKISYVVNTPLQLCSLISQQPHRTMREQVGYRHNLPRATVEGPVAVTVERRPAAATVVVSISRAKQLTALRTFSVCTVWHHLRYQNTMQHQALVARRIAAEKQCGGTRRCSSRISTTSVSRAQQQQYSSIVCISGTRVLLWMLWYVLQQYDWYYCCAYDTRPILVVSETLHYCKPAATKHNTMWDISTRVWGRRRRSTKMFTR